MASADPHHSTLSPSLATSNALSSLSLAPLLATAHALRASPTPPTLHGSPSFGTSHVILRLAHSDNTHWAAKLALLPPAGGETMLGREAATLRWLEGVAPGLKVPRVHAYSVPEVEEEKEFVLMDWMEGSHLWWTDEWPAERGKREWVLEQLAELAVVLRVAEVRKGVGKEDSDEWFLERADERIAELLEGRRRDYDLVDCLLFRDKVERTCVRPEIGWHRFVLAHDALSADNILVDEEFNITGIIDWTSPHTGRPIPLLSALVHPTCISLTHSSLLATSDRALYRTHYAAAESRHNLPSAAFLFDDSELQRVMLALSNKDAFERFFAEGERGKKDWEIVAVQLDKFLERRGEEMERLETVRAVRELVREELEMLARGGRFV